MHKSVIALAIFSAMSVPSLAQTTPAPGAAPAAKPQTVTKVVCKRVESEETTGSRLGSAPKVCKKVQVPVTAQKAKPADQQQSNGGANN